MTTYTPGLLAHIQLANSKGDIYAPSGVAHVRTIVLHNTNTSTETVEILYHDGSNEYQHWKVDLVQNETLIIEFRGEGLMLAGGSSAKLTGNTTTATKVTCTITGTEES